MADIREKLESLLHNKGVMAGQEWRQRLETLRQEREAGTFEVDKAVPGKVCQTDETQGFYLVNSTFPLDAMQGNIELGAGLQALPEHIALSACDEELEGFDPATACYVDTETTGLSGGTGTAAFLVGVAYFEGDSLRLDQCFMRDYDDEEPMLAYLAGLLKRFETVVAYNGKSFDLPLMRTRFIQNRIPFRLDDALQFDLLHAARRFWKRRLGNCSLTNVERAILDIRRQGDVSGEMIPRLWFEYLRTRDARPLTPIFYHHKMDILSLVALTGWLSRALAAESDSGFEHAEDRLSLVHLHFRRREYDKVLVNGRRLLESEMDASNRIACLRLLGAAGKRMADWDLAREYFELVLEEKPSDFLARHELAKLHEHRTRDLDTAERICVEALSLLETRMSLGRDDGTCRSSAAAFQRRLDRLRKKLKRYGSGGSGDLL